MAYVALKHGKQMIPLSSVKKPILVLFYHYRETFLIRRSSDGEDAIVVQAVTTMTPNPFTVRPDVSYEREVGAT